MLLVGLVLCAAVGLGWLLASRQLLVELRRVVEIRRATTPDALGRNGPVASRPPPPGEQRAEAPLREQRGEPQRAPVRPTATPGWGQHPPAGAVEVRLLCSRPELVGDLRPPVTAATVQLVAYLALHGGGAASQQLCEALGAGHGEAGTCETGIEQFAAAALTTLGAHLLVVGGESRYRLAATVSCDWVRFGMARSQAQLARKEGELAGELDALCFALGLLGDGVPASPAAPAARYDWLELDGVLEDIYLGVLDVARRLGTLGLELGDLDLVAFALGRGRRFVPESAQLRELATLLGEARLLSSAPKRPG